MIHISKSELGDNDTFFSLKLNANCEDTLPKRIEICKNRVQGLHEQFKCQPSWVYENGPLTTETTAKIQQYDIPCTLNTNKTIESTSRTPAAL